jgi:hypothetical protein
MDIRQANADDVADIRRVARESLAESYGHALDEDLIDSVVGKWYGSDDLSSDLADDDTYFVVAEDDGELVGFVQSYVVSRREIVGEIDWPPSSKRWRRNSPNEASNGWRVSSSSRTRWERGSTTTTASRRPVNESSLSVGRSSKNAST